VRWLPNSIWHWSAKTSLTTPTRQSGLSAIGLIRSLLWIVERCRPLSFCAILQWVMCESSAWICAFISLRLLSP
jgi:hypothetical protein